MKKKWVVFCGFVLVGMVALATFVLCCNNLAYAEEYGFYKQELFFDEQTHALEGKQVVGFFNYSDSVLTQGYLHLYANAFRDGAKAKVVSLANVDKAYPNGKSYGYITIESVCAGDDYLTFEIGGEDENILIVDFGCDVFPDDMFVFEVGFKVQLPNVNHRFGYGENTVNFCNYYPIMCVYENGGWVTDLYDSNGDPFYSKIANYEVELTYAEDFVLASTGTQEVCLQEGKNVAKITADKVRDFAMVLSKKFELKVDVFDNIHRIYKHTKKGTSCEVPFLLNEKFNKNYFSAKYALISSSSKMFCVLKM
jgi:hypothetical protein